MKKRWFEEATFMHRPHTSPVELVAWQMPNKKIVTKRIRRDERDGLYIIRLPNAKAGQKKFVFITKNKKDDSRIRKLMTLFECAIYDRYYAKKWYQFWKRR